MDITEILKTLADDVRLRILNILKEGEFCVCDIENSLNLSQSNASRHLTKLKNFKIINAEKKAQWVYYSLNKEIFKEYEFIEILLKTSFKAEIFNKDMENLKEYLKNKKGDVCNV